MKNYLNFKKYILRTPIIPIKEVLNPTYDLNYFKDRKVFLQGIRLASPSLYKEYKRYHEHGLKNEKEETRLYVSLLKYFTRSGMRCTPFGLFAGLSIGAISNNENIIIEKTNKFSPNTRLDSNFLCSIIQNLERKKEIKDQLSYTVNNSLYFLGDKIRYVEYHYINSRRSHQVSSIDNNEYINIIIDSAKEGATIAQLSKHLVDPEISYEEAYSFIEELIDNQILVSNLYPIVTGDNLQDFLIQQLERLELKDLNELTLLNTTRDEVSTLDKTTVGKGTELYSKVTDIIKELNTPFQEKHLFQTDLNTSFELNEISEDLVNEVKEAITVLNRLNSELYDTNLTRFRDSFYERYGDQEISLNLALDTETGIGYLQNFSSYSGDNNPLVDDLNIRIMGGQNASQITWNRKQDFLFRKVVESIKNNETEINITLDDLKLFNENWNDLPSSFSAMLEIVKKEGENKIILGSVGGSSALNLLGRFSHVEENIENYIYEIAKKEKELNPNYVLAEIVHLPESRVGNILARGVLREYEIPYLAQSSVSQDFQIPIDDLFISIKNRRLVLRSKRLNKEVKPHLSNAHNFSMNALPVYQFLADMQSQNIRNNITFSWGRCEDQFNYLPRLSYKNVILALAIWTIKGEEVEKFQKEKDEDKIMEIMNEFRSAKKLPEKVVLADGDNELFINLSNIASVIMLLSTIKNRAQFKLKEFLFSDKESLVYDQDGNGYANEVILAFHKNVVQK